MTDRAAGVTRRRVHYPIIRQHPYEVPEDLEQFRDEVGLEEVLIWSGSERGGVSVRRREGAHSDPSFSTNTSAPGHPSVRSDSQLEFKTTEQNYGLTQVVADW